MKPNLSDIKTELKYIKPVSTGSEAVSELNAIVDDLGIKNAVLILDEVVAGIADHIVRFLQNKYSKLIVINPKGNDIAEVEKIIGGLKSSKIQAVIGVGGGRTIDVSKMVASKIDAKVIAFPTLVSHDGIASPVAVLLDKKVKKQSLAARMPVAVVVDLDLIGRSPIASIRAGVGDLVSNFSAVEDWKLAAARKGEDFHDLAAIISLTAASSIFELHEIGETYPRRPEFVRRLVNGLILSGVAMSIAGSSRPASGAEHNISHAIDALFNLGAYHGEQVALGTIVATYLRGGNWEAFLNFFKKIGLPVTHTDIGLSEADYIKAILYAPKTRKGRYTIIDEVRPDEKMLRKILKNINRSLMG